MKQCTIEGCTEKHLARGMCNIHYRRQRRADQQVRPPHRPRKREYDMARAEEFLKDGASYREVSHTLKIPRTTLRENLPDYGWTAQEGGQFKGFVARTPARQRLYYQHLFDNTRRFD